MDREASYRHPESEAKDLLFCPMKDTIVSISSGHDAKNGAAHHHRDGTSALKLRLLAQAIEILLSLVPADLILQ